MSERSAESLRHAKDNVAMVQETISIFTELANKMTPRRRNKFQRKLAEAEQRSILVSALLEKGELCADEEYLLHNTWRHTMKIMKRCDLSLYTV